MACPVTMSSLRDSEPMWGDASLLHTGHPSGIQEEEHHFSDSLLETNGVQKFGGSGPPCK